jgi:hypothetical protein
VSGRPLSVVRFHTHHAGGNELKPVDIRDSGRNFVTRSSLTGTIFAPARQSARAVKNRGATMVTKKEQNDLLIGPKAAIVLAVLTIMIGLLAWGLAPARQDRGNTSYDLMNPGKTVQEPPAAQTQFPFGEQSPVQNRAPGHASINK